MEAADLPLRPTDFELYKELEIRLIKIGYGCQRRNEIRNEMWHKMVTLDPRFKNEDDEGPTAIFTYTCTATKYTSKLCSSFAVRTGVFKKEGYIFCLIEDEKGNAVYWATLTKRTKNQGMIDRAVSRAKLCYERARARPVCQDEACRQRYDLRHFTHKSGRRSYWWQCPNVAYHGKGKCPHEGPDYNLPEEQLEFVAIERANREADANDSRRVTERGSGWGKRQPRYVRPKQVT